MLGHDRKPIVVVSIVIDVVVRIVGVQIQSEIGVVVPQNVLDRVQILLV